MIAAASFRQGLGRMPMPAVEAMPSLALEGGLQGLAGPQFAIVSGHAIERPVRPGPDEADAMIGFLPKRMRRDKLLQHCHNPAPCPGAL